MIYCRACGLMMSNGFCPHIDDVSGAIAARQAEAAAREKRGGKKTKKGKKGY